MPEDASLDERLCDSCIRLKAFQEELITDRPAACARLAKAKVAEWMEDGSGEVARVIAGYMEDRQAFSDEFLLELAANLSYPMEDLL